MLLELAERRPDPGIAPFLAEQLVGAVDPMKIRASHAPLERRAHLGAIEIVEVEPDVALADARRRWVVQLLEQGNDAGAERVDRGLRGAIDVPLLERAA